MNIHQKLDKGRKFLVAGKFAQALPLYEKLSRSCQGDPVIWFEYGNAAAGSREPELAERAWRKAMGLAPRNAGLLLQIGPGPAHAEGCSLLLRSGGGGGAARH